LIDFLTLVKNDISLAIYISQLSNRRLSLLSLRLYCYLHVHERSNLWRIY